MGRVISLLGYGWRIGSLIVLLLMPCLATAVETGQLHDDKPVVGQPEAGLLSWSLTRRDFECLQDRQACSTGRAAASRKAVDMRPCLVASRPDQGQEGTVPPSAQVAEIPACYFTLLADMQDVDYPSPELFWQAVKARVTLASYNYTLRKKLAEVLVKYQVTRIDAALLQKLRAEAAIAAQLAMLEGVQLDSPNAPLHELFSVLGERFEQYRSLVLEKARKLHRYDAASPMHWSVVHQTTAQRNLAGEVYGFMPFWLTGEQRAIDFGAQTRLGYYAVGFDDRGIITHDEGWRTLDAGFVDKVGKSGGKLDMVVYRNDWTAWSQLGPAKKKQVLARLAENIVNLLAIPRSDLLSRATPYLTLGMKTAPTVGDGVTLYFEHYPEDSESVAAFSQFLDELEVGLQSGKRNRSLNIMLRSEEIGRGIFDYQRLVERVERRASRNQQTLLLALLPEPTSDGKKQLRQNIENGLHGKQRMSLLRHLVAVISFDGHNENQLVDDIIYANDNFGGIGFWTQPGAASGAAINSALQHNYRVTRD